MWIPSREKKDGEKNILYFFFFYKNGLVVKGIKTSIVYNDVFLRIF